MSRLIFASIVFVFQKLPLGLVSLVVLGIVGGGSVSPSVAPPSHLTPHCWLYIAQADGSPGYLRPLDATQVQTDSVAKQQLVPGQRVCSSTPAARARKKVSKPVVHVLLQKQWTYRPQQPYQPPVPPPQKHWSGSVAAMITQVFGPYAQQALHVAGCESGLNPNAYNPYSVGGSHAEGVFQILYPSTWDGTPEASQSPYNPMANILAAHSIFTRDGNSWRAWTCQP